MSLNWTSWAVTHVGSVRAGNEDTLVDRPEERIWAVADGAGGHEHGEVASGMLKVVLETPTVVAGADLVLQVRARVGSVHDELRRRADTETEETGRPVIIASTVVVFLALGEHFACLWCGDSRAYLLRGSEMTQLSKDHSLVQELVDSGLVAAADAERHPHANVLTRVIGGPGPAPDLDKITGQAQPWDRFLLCSDGLFKALEAETIAPILAGPDPAQSLIVAALAAKARDNITAVVIEASGPDRKPDQASTLQPVDHDSVLDGDDATMLRRPA